MLMRTILYITLLASINSMKSFKEYLIENNASQIKCDINGICQRVIQDESAGNEKKVLKVYKDSKGLPTIGHGHLINRESNKVLGQVIPDKARVSRILAGKDSLSEKEAMGVLKLDVEKRLPGLKKLIPSFETQSPELQSTLYSEYHRGMLQQSPNAVKKFNQGDYEGFATNYVDAKDYRESKAADTGIYKRMDRLVNAARMEGQARKKAAASKTNQESVGSSTSQTAPSR